MEGSIFTGERWEAYTELLFLRARYYEPTSGRFTSRDPWSGDIMRPSTLQAWIYAGNNPVWLVDPSGLQTPAPQPVPTPPPPGGPVPTSTPIPTAVPQPEVPDYRDLTHWLYNELHEQVNSWYVQRLVALRSRSQPDRYVRAYAAWYLLVRNEAKWDFKHKIRDTLGRSILLGHEPPVRWYEYSVPGNIFYGFIGSAATFTGIELHTGAGYAEITDQAHVDDGEAGWCFLKCVYVNWDWLYTEFDEPGDWQNVQFGIDMFKNYGRTLTFDQFQNRLSTHGNSLTKGSQWKSNDVQPDWPYRVGRFNGKNAVRDELVIRLLLSEAW